MVGRRMIAAMRNFLAEGDWRRSTKFSERPLIWRIAYLALGGLLFVAILRFWVFSQ